MRIGASWPITIVLITLKITGFIAWSWLWVLSPIWVPASIIVFGRLIYVIFFR
jgi:hypothetical protein